MSTFALTEGEALPDATRVFTSVAPAAGTLTALAIDGYTPGFTLVTSVQVAAVEKLSHNYSVDALYAAQSGGSFYGSVAQGAAITVLVVGDADGVSATVS